MRTISGDIIVPANCPITSGATVLIEVRDVSLADAPSKVVAHMQLTGVNLKPNDILTFSLTVPEVQNNRSLELRAHIKLSKSKGVNPGDLLTTVSYSVPNQGTHGRMFVPVTLI